MKGSVKWQATQILTQSGILKIGESKHLEKEVARFDGAKTWHDIGKELGIHSYSTAEAYKDVWAQALSYCKGLDVDLRTNDLEKITAKQINAFLQSKVTDGVAYSTYQQYASALEKLETALNMYSEKHDRGHSYDFKNGFESRERASQTLEHFDRSRAYENPEKIIENLSGKHEIAARIQIEGGARISEASHLSEKHLLGDGKIFVENGKGGKDREILISKETYSKLEQVVKEMGKFVFDKNEYRADLKESARITGQEYEGSHGLRWNFAQNRMLELQNGGMGYEQALSQVSHEMGHNRNDITVHYQK